MLKNLPQGTKISITRSITLAFKQYMNRIAWNEDKFDPAEFVQEWRDYIEKHSTWFHSLDDKVKQDPSFHEELAKKINEVMEKVLNEQPSSEQIEKIQRLAEELNIKDIHYSCKAEADYHIERLQKLKGERK
jgi:tRNA nucleotidyltransferase/poly(A) polymerase